MSTILNIHLNKTGKVSDKWSSYLSYYDDLFLELKYKEINLLEVGVRNGGSLDTWSEYFKYAKNIIGCDIDELCSSLKYNDERIKVIVNDIKHPDTFSDVKKITDTLDIVIDDGSHKSVDILETFVKFFPMLTPGGIYVIEDTHTLYWKEWGDELNNKFNAYIFFKKLIDVINFQFWKNESTFEELFKDFILPGNLPEFITEGLIDSIEFRNSLIIVKKSKPPYRNYLGRRIVTGTIELGNNDDLTHHQNIDNNIFSVISAIGNNYGIFSYEQRFNQLLESIDSIKKYAPDSDIVLIEASEELIPKHDFDSLKSKVNHIISLNNDPYITFLKNHCKDPSPNKFEKKTVGEIQSCIAFLEYLKQQPKSYKRVFKLGGRLTLNSNFSLDFYDNEDRLIVLDKEQWYDEMIFPMRLWSFGFNYLDNFLELFYNIQQHTYELVTHTKKLELVEFTFTKLVEKMQIPYRIVDRVGVSGQGGLSGSKIDE